MIFLVSPSPGPGSLLTVFLLLLTEVLYWCLHLRLSSYLTHRRDSIQSLWWGVYVLTAPLLFSTIAWMQVALVAVLFTTRFVVDCLHEARGHWLVAVTSARGLPYAQKRIEGAPLLEEFAQDEIDCR